MDDREQYTSLPRGEEMHRAALCACLLTRDQDGRVCLYLCPMHEAAADLLALLREAVRFCPVEVQNRILAAILRARGEP